jgi:basic amino acid/polyamine antiporter, APA family
MVPLIPILGIVFCLLLMFSLPVDNWLRLILWLLLGFAVYFPTAPKYFVLDSDQLICLYFIANGR